MPVYINLIFKMLLYIMIDKELEVELEVFAAYEPLFDIDEP